MPPSERLGSRGRSALQGGAQQDAGATGLTRRLGVTDEEGDEDDGEINDVLTSLAPEKKRNNIKQARKVVRREAAKAALGLIPGQEQEDNNNEMVSREAAKAALGSLPGQQQRKELEKLLLAKEYVRNLKAWLGKLTPKDSAAISIQKCWKNRRYLVESKHNSQLESAVNSWSMAGMFKACCRQRFKSCVNRFVASFVLDPASLSSVSADGTLERFTGRWAGLRRYELATMDRALPRTAWVNFARDHQLLHQMCSLRAVVAEFAVRASDQRLNVVIGGVRLAFAVLRRIYGEAYPANSIPSDPVITTDEGGEGGEQKEEEEGDMAPLESENDYQSDGNRSDEDGGSSDGNEDDDNSDEDEGADGNQQPGFNFSVPRVEILHIFVALGAPASFSEKGLVSMGCRKMMTEKDVVRLLRKQAYKSGEIVWDRPNDFQGIDFEGFESCVEKMIDIRWGHPLLRAMTKKAPGHGVSNAINSPDNFSPTKASHKPFQHPPSPRTWRYQSMIMKRDAVAIVSGDSTKPQEDGCSAREQHISAFIYEIVSPLSDTIVKTGRSGSETAVGYVLNLPGVVDLMLKNEQELQMCYEDYASRNKGGEIRYEDLLEFAVRVGFAQSIPNDLSSKFLLLRAFLACKSGNQVGVDLHWKDFDADTLVCPSVGRFRLKSRSRWEIRYRAKYYPPPDQDTPAQKGFFKLMGAMRGIAAPVIVPQKKKKKKEVEKDPDTTMISAHDLESVLSSVGFHALPGELQSLRAAFGDTALPVAGELSARQLHEKLFEVRATSVMLRDIRLTFPEFSVCIVLLSHISAVMQHMTVDQGWAAFGNSRSASFDNAFLSSGSAERTRLEIVRTFQNIRVAYQLLDVMTKLPDVPPALDGQLRELLRTVFEQRRERRPLPLEKLTALIAQMACFPLLAERGCGLYFIRQLGLDSNFEVSDPDEFVRIMDRIISEELVLMKLHPSAEEVQWLKYRLVLRLKAMQKTMNTGGPANLDSMIKTAAVDRRRLNIARKLVVYSMHNDFSGHIEPRFSDEQEFMGMVDFWSGCHVCVLGAHSEELDQVPLLRETVDDIMRTAEKNKWRKLHSVPGIVDMAYEDDDDDDEVPQTYNHTDLAAVVQKEDAKESEFKGDGVDTASRPPTENPDADGATVASERGDAPMEDEYSALGSPRRARQLRPRRRKAPRAPKLTLEERASMALARSSGNNDGSFLSQYQELSPTDLFLAGEKCLQAGRDEQAISIMTKLLENANSSTLRHISLERQVDVLSRLLNKQAVKPAQLVARPLSQALRGCARQLNREQVTAAHEVLQRQQRLAEQHELKVEKAYGAAQLGVVLCSMRLGCDIARQPSFALVVPSAQNAEKMLALGTGLIDKADICLWVAARSENAGSGALSVDDGTSFARSMSGLTLMTGSVASVQSFGVKTADPRTSDASNRDRTCDEAIECFDFMLTMARRRKNEDMQHDAHRFLSQCYLLKGDRRQALTHATISNDMSRGMALREAESLQQLGRVYMEFGEFGLAVETFVNLIRHCEQALSTLSRAPAQPGASVQRQPSSSSSSSSSSSLVRPRGLRPSRSAAAHRTTTTLPAGAAKLAGNSNGNGNIDGDSDGDGDGEGDGGSDRSLYSRCLAAARCFYGKALLLSGNVDAALAEFRLQQEAAQSCNDDVGAVVARLNVGFALRTIGGRPQLKAAAALYEYYLTWSTADRTEKALRAAGYASNAAQVMAAMQTHAHFCLSEVHSGLSQDGDALAHRKHLHSLDQLHGDVNTLGEIFAKRAVCELRAVDVRPSSLLDDSDDDDEEEEEGEVATVLE